mgnify:CR=1 FL=1
MNLKTYFFNIFICFCLINSSISDLYGSDTLVIVGDTWQYLDDGSNQGSLWNANNFDDSSWQTGTAQFGYGDGDETTAISYGNNFLDKHITYYFRKHFTINDLTAVNALFIRLLIDAETEARSRARAERSSRSVSSRVSLLARRLKRVRSRASVISSCGQHSRATGKPSSALFR